MREIAKFGLRFWLLIGAAALAACTSHDEIAAPGSPSSGTSSSSGASSSSGTSSSGSASSGTPGFTIAAPAHASSGPNLPLFATGGASQASFGSSGSNPPAVGTVYPLTQSALTFTSTGISPDATANSGGATAKLTTLGTGSGSTKIEFTVPSLSLDATNISTDGSDNTIAGGKDLTFDSNSLNYVLYGNWGLNPSASSNSPTNAAFFITGYQTPATNMPTGNATYSANGSTTSGTTGAVTGVVAIPSGSSFSTAQLAGAASFSVNFGTGAITGNLTGITATPNGGGTGSAWNSVSLSGNIAGGTSTFAGTTATSAAAGGTYGFSSSATGLIDGAFYGPNGQELGAVWSLHDGSGTSGKLAIGAVSATKQ